MDQGTRRALEALFRPKSIAVVGASPRADKIGYGMLKNLLEGGFFTQRYNRAFPGKVYVVNPFEKEVLGRPSYAKLTDIPGEVDLAIVAVPYKVVPQVIVEAGQKKVKTAIVISAGYSETGPEGMERERELVSLARKGGVRILGPNNLGIIRPAESLNATFAPAMPPQGRNAFISQSGAIIAAVIDWAISARYSFSTMVSIGNAADIDTADVIEWLAEDRQTDVITLYIEGLRKGRAFYDAVKQAAKRKPVLLLKGGRTDYGSKAASSHTGSMAGSFALYRGAMRQAGVHLVDSMEELFDLSKVLTEAPMAKKNAVAVITNAGGIGVLLADYCDMYGVNLVPLEESTLKRFDASGIMHPSYSRRNPLDLVGDARADRYKLAIDTLLSEPYIHGLIVAQVLDTVTQPIENARAIVEAAHRHRNKPIVAAFIGGRFSHDGMEILRHNNIPDYNDPQKAAKAMAALCGTL